MIFLSLTKFIFGYGERAVVCTLCVPQLPRGEPVWYKRLPVTPFRTDNYFGYYYPRAYHKTQYTPGETVLVEVDTNKIAGGVAEVHSISTA